MTDPGFWNVSFHPSDNFHSGLLTPSAIFKRTQFGSWKGLFPHHIRLQSVSWCHQLAEWPLQGLEMGPDCDYRSPAKPGGENFVTYFFLLWSYWKRFLRFPTKTSAVGSQQSANRPLYGEIGSGPVIKSRFVRFWWHRCVPVTLADNWISVNIQCRYKFFQRWSSVDNWTVLKHARQGQSECQLCGVPGGYKQYGGPILGRTMRVCGTKLEKVENNERQFSCCEPATWRPKAPPFPTPWLSNLTWEEYYQVEQA